MASATALTTPLSVTGTPNELDEQLPGQLVEFVETHLALSSTLKSAKEQTEAAAKASKGSSQEINEGEIHSGSSASATPSPAQVQIEVGTKESSDDSASTPEHTQPSTAGAGGGAGASTGSLFDLEAKNDE